MPSSLTLLGGAAGRQVSACRASGLQSVDGGGVDRWSGGFFQRQIEDGATRKSSTSLYRLDVAPVLMLCAAPGRGRV